MTPMLVPLRSRDCCPAAAAQYLPLTSTLPDSTTHPYRDWPAATMRYSAPARSGFSNPPFVTSCVAAARWVAVALGCRVGDAASVAVATGAVTVWVAEGADVDVGDADCAGCMAAVPTVGLGTT